MSNRGTGRLESGVMNKLSLCCNKELTLKDHKKDCFHIVMYPVCSHCGKSYRQAKEDAVERSKRGAGRP